MSKKYCVINGPRGVLVQQTRGRAEGTETAHGVIAWNSFPSREAAETAASRLRETQDRVEPAAWRIVIAREAIDSREYQSLGDYESAVRALAATPAVELPDEGEENNENFINIFKGI